MRPWLLGAFLALLGLAAVGWAETPAPPRSFTGAPGEWVYACFPDLASVAAALSVMSTASADAAKVIPVAGATLPRLPGGSRAGVCLLYR